MMYRKFLPTAIFTGNEFLKGEQVLITDAGGTIREIIARENAGDDLEVIDGTICPGFVNAHCHLELSHMKGKVEPGKGLVEFLIRVIRQRGADKEQIAEAMAAAENEMFDNGIVAVGDICNINISAALKSQSRLRWYNFIEVLGFTESQAANRITAGEETLQSFLNSGLADSAISPHAPYSVSRSLFEKINTTSAGKKVTMHNQESMAEDDLFRSGSGNMFLLYKNLNIDPSDFIAPETSSAEFSVPLLELTSSLLLVHNTYITSTDIRFLKSRKTGPQLYFCLCPSANKYIENIAPPAQLLHDLGAEIVLGTDSYASNWQLNILEEIKLLHQQNPSISISELLKWGTLNGAKALGFDDTLGSFAKGKKPGIVLLKGVGEEVIEADANSKRIL